MKIVIGMTGSVATTIAPKIVLAIAEGVPNCDAIDVVMTEKAQMFQNAERLARETGAKVYTERDEWVWRIEDKTEHTYVDGHTVTLPKPEPVFTDRWQKGYPILHVDLGKTSSALVIAPASMNTIAKMAHGITDNLLTSVYSAWDISCRPVIIAPAMNTKMWESPQNTTNIEALVSRGVKIVYPVEAMLACGDFGVGALARADVIAKEVAAALRWHFPVPQFWGGSGIPVGAHPGAFGAVRKHDRHCGVDLYCQAGTPVEAVEGGRVVLVEDFTGPAANCPWWLPTKAVKVEGPSGVVCYGEISPYSHVKVGDIVKAGDEIGVVIPVLRPEKLRKDIPGHMCSMLHFQLYEHGKLHLHGNDWGRDAKMPIEVIDPTPFLLSAHGAGNKLEMT